MIRERAFLIIFGVANLGLVIYGFLALANPGMLLEPIFVNALGSLGKPEAVADFLAAIFRLLGYLNLVLGLLGLILIWRYLTIHQTWLADTIMLITILSYLGPIVFDNTAGKIGGFEFIEHVLFASMTLFALVTTVARNIRRLPIQEGMR